MDVTILETYFASEFHRPTWLPQDFLGHIFDHLGNPILDFSPIKSNQDPRKLQTLGVLLNSMLQASDLVFSAANMETPISDGSSSSTLTLNRCGIRFCAQIVDPCSESKSLSASFENKFPFIIALGTPETVNPGRTRAMIGKIIEDLVEKTPNYGTKADRTNDKKIKLLENVTDQEIDQLFEGF